MKRLHGRTSGVGRDILFYLDEVASYFDTTFVITSGYRTKAQQADAMLKNWLKLERGSVYSKKALPEVERVRLDGLYKTAKEDATAAVALRQDAKSQFLQLAIEKVGSRSMHSNGRAVDITQASVSPTAYLVIAMKLAPVREGKRRDIYHFESERLIPRPTELDRKQWDQIAAKQFSPKHQVVVAMSAARASCSHECC
jgi:uncharacterized protein YcbK (DUF882 family)